MPITLKQVDIVMGQHINIWTPQQSQIKNIEEIHKSQKKERNSSKTQKKTITPQNEKQKEETENKYKNNWKARFNMATNTYYQ